MYHFGVTFSSASTAYAPTDSESFYDLKSILPDFDRISRVVFPDGLFINAHPDRFFRQIFAL
jgi:hypothetical protein